MSTQLDLTRRPERPEKNASLAGLSIAALRSELEAFGLHPKKAKMRAAQIRGWAHAFGVTSFDEMTNISKELRSKLSESFLFRVLKSLSTSFPLMVRKNG